MFIILTDAETDKQIRLNIRHITSYTVAAAGPPAARTLLRMSEGPTRWYKEPATLVDERIRECSDPQNPTVPYTAYADPEVETPE